MSYVNDGEELKWFKAEPVVRQGTRSKGPLFRKATKSESVKVAGVYFLYPNRATAQLRAILQSRWRLEVGLSSPIDDMTRKYENCTKCSDSCRCSSTVLSGSRRSKEETIAERSWYASVQQSAAFRNSKTHLLYNSWIANNMHKPEVTDSNLLRNINSEWTRRWIFRRESKGYA